MADPTGRLATFAVPRLSTAQKRHLVELLGDGSKILYWHMTYCSPQHRSAVALQKKGLVKQEGSIFSRSGGGYVLTDLGREVAEALRG